MIYKVGYTGKAWKDLQKLDISISQRIAKKMRFFMEKSDPMKYAKELKRDYKGLFRFRIGDYRVIFSKDSKGTITVLTVLRIKHRMEVYS